ncbi:MAG: hypothetical protein RL699_673 [Bacteroidota bacterium]|jgi:NADH:ubiquinone oxidoreductase subunit 5 (subunit L)/multisubunit Na+/H+ antiporter MnhA subunit
MEFYIYLFVLIPLLSFAGSIWFSKKNEKAIAAWSIGMVGLQFVVLLAYVVYWMTQGFKVFSQYYFTFYQEDQIHIFLELFWDKITVVFALTGAVICFFVALYSKFYLHRDAGYKRFFVTLQLFFFAYNLVVFAGNFETLFMGWEFLGITSFLLIIYYRDRYLPVKNGLKTISLYRLADVCLLLALWMSHHLWHQNITFLQLQTDTTLQAYSAEHYNYTFFIVLMLVLAAMIKSAQFPFSSWLTRAMEGPTTSSAIFYGSLSAHIGVFLLLRTTTYWEETIPVFRYILLGIGLVTALISALIARVQSSVKTQIAYSSITQIGIMFIEIGLGWYDFALFHFVTNAFLRTYQLLVSPSVLGYLIHDQFFNYTPFRAKPISVWYGRLQSTFYLLSIKEWNMDTFQRRLLWNPFKQIGRYLSFLNNRLVLVSISVFYVVGLVLFIYPSTIPDWLNENLHLLFAIIAFLLVLKSFAKRTDALAVWFMIVASQFYLLLAIAIFNDAYEFVEIIMYCSGLSIAAVLGFYCLYQVKAKERKIDLNDFYGYIHNHPKYGFLFLLSCLAFVGLPFTPTFIGVDLMFSHIEKEEYLLLGLVCGCFLFVEISVLRIYARLFLGPNKLLNHPVAYRSS